MALLGACATPTPYAAPGFDFASRFRGAPGNSVLLANTAWWLRIGDPVLDRLIERALARNLSIAAASSRIAEAEAAYRAIPGAALLQSSAALRLEGTDDSGPDRVGQGQIGLSWMLDPYGARRASLKAAAAEVEASDAELDAARLLVIYNLANAYLDLRFQQRLAALAEEELRTRRLLVGLGRQLLTAGQTTEIEVTRTAAQLAEVEAGLPGLRARVIAAQARISVLAGDAPGTMPVDLSPRDQPLARISSEVGIPADLLRNRPDIRIAERRYYAAVAGIDGARAALYPSLSLTGSITLNALQGGRAAEYYLGPMLNLPDLPTKAARASVSQAQSRARQAHLNWTSTVLGALAEVETALAGYGAANQALDASTRAARLYRQARDLTRQVFDGGEATLGELNDAELDRAAAERALAQARLEQARAFVELSVRLGSGSTVAGVPR